MEMVLIPYTIIQKLIEKFFYSGLNIKLVKHPPQSPYLNVLYVGYFNSIQSLNKLKVYEDVDYLIITVVDFYDELEKRNLVNIWMT